MIDFALEGSGDLTVLMQEAGIVSFNDACRFVSTIPYQRISDREDLSLVYHERRGTCSSKHAFLKQLAHEQGRDEVELMLVYFKMSGESHACLTDFFVKIGLEYIPEAHVCLRYKEQMFDYTTRFNWDFSALTLEEHVIDIPTLLKDKIKQHQRFIANWNNTQFSNEQIWLWREECIALLSQQ